MEDSYTHKRRSIRYAGYDYSSSGSYFVTIATHLRKAIFGKIVDDEMKLNRFGRIAHEQWFKTAALRSEVILYGDEFVVMPNHIHGIIHIDNPSSTITVDPIAFQNENSINSVVGAQRRCAPTPIVVDDKDHCAPTNDHAINIAPHSLGAIVRAYKSAVTYAIHACENSPHTPVWQRNYYEHIIVNEKEYQKIAEYITFNPVKWEEDMEFYNTNRGFA